MKAGLLHRDMAQPVYHLDLMKRVSFRASTGAGTPLSNVVFLPVDTLPTLTSCSVYSGLGPAQNTSHLTDEPLISWALTVVTKWISPTCCSEFPWFQERSSMFARYLEGVRAIKERALCTVFLPDFLSECSSSLDMTCSLLS